MDLYSYLTEIVITLFKHGWNVTTWGIGIALFFKMNGVRKILLRRVPKRFRHEDKLDRIERKIDILLAREEGSQWIASSSEVITPSSQRRSVTPFIGRWVASITAKRARNSITLNLRRKRIMSKLKSRKFILAVVSAILIVLNDGLDFGIDSNTVLAFAGIIATYIVGETAVDVSKAKKGVADDSTFTTPNESTK